MVRRIGFPDDAPFLIRDIDGAYTYYGLLWKLTPPVLADFSWTNQGSSSVSDVHGGLYLTAAGGASPNLRVLHKAQPAKPYTISTRFSMIGRTTGTQFGGLCWRDSAGGGLVTAHITNNLTLLVARYTSPTVLSANYQSVALSNYVVNGLFFLRLEDDNTSRIVSISADGFNWTVVHSIGNTDFITADQVGFFANPGSGSIPTGLWLQHWEEG